MTQKTARAVDQALGDLPLDERIAALVVSVVTRDPEAVHAIVRLLAVASAMTGRLSLERRIALSELMRDCADHCEHHRQRIEIG